MDYFANYEVVVEGEEGEGIQEEFTHPQWHMTSTDSMINDEITELLNRLPRIKLRPDHALTQDANEEQEESTALTPLQDFYYERDIGGHFISESTPEYSISSDHYGFLTEVASSSPDLEQIIFQLRDALFPTATEDELEYLLQDVFPTSAGAADDEVFYNKESGLCEDVVLQNLLPRASLQEDAEEICSICLENYGAQEVIGKLRCGHEHHLDCIKNWILVDNSCPLCKTQAVSMPK
ncbi:OLC1v1023846C1 [Oldenlandia corymbosa var. corymbosa]|uniref:RING-type E3 ubiquitin transferase n=1 Tax=Oldenlandia corymbosa var. corymbosa TaxID=529605 RepID=A0AAV1C0V7_OLDCO|nr:OLC1v1023846C1 [Oldenlandia corymbosa var. corymbosa]